MSGFERPEARGVSESGAPDLRRLEVASRRFLGYIADGIEEAIDKEEEISEDTARCIAHVLGRAFGRESSLAELGRTGAASYAAVRDEYLTLYSDPAVSEPVTTWIDWLGDRLSRHEAHELGFESLSQSFPPRLADILVPTIITIGRERFIVRIPGDRDSHAIRETTDALSLAGLPENAALQGFLTLPDVSAAIDDVPRRFQELFVGTFASEDEVLRALSPLEDWETSLADWCIDNGVDLDSLEWNLAPLMERLRGIYDVVNWEDKIHVFDK